VVFGQLLRKAPHHASKIPHAPFYEKLIQEILGLLRPDRAFPSTLTLEEQGLFALGYYHQRQDLFTKRTDGKTPETPEKGE
jgi:CRISPR-associated protein Csd1